MDFINIKTNLLLPNDDQIAGVPRNPRRFKKDDIDKIAASLRETPELFNARPCIVYPLEGKYIVLGGNMRFRGALLNKTKEVPCVVVPSDTDAEKLCEIVIKDNGTFGAWDYDLLANEWGHDPLADWGVAGVPEADDDEDEGTGTGSREFGEDAFSENMTMHFKFNESDAEFVRAKLGAIDADYSKAILKLLNYEA